MVSVSQFVASTVILTVVPAITTIPFRNVTARPQGALAAVLQVAPLEELSDSAPSAQMRPCHETKQM